MREPYVWVRRNWKRKRARALHPAARQALPDLIALKCGERSMIGYRQSADDVAGGANLTVTNQITPS
ncbi:hypothetical protein [Donghicola tyrosinivorans]|uniref:hypothetical protein n=1 Tax=Donghicola tyrosinivorans TaxID=1652492 RepID=UPI0014730549|nr:hypothetical protein [Donghicola tyrosinivorans]